MEQWATHTNTLSTSLCFGLFLSLLDTAIVTTALCTIGVDSNSLSRNLSSIDGWSPLHANRHCLSFHTFKHSGARAERVPKVHGFQVFVGLGFDLTVSTVSLLAAIECEIEDHGISFSFPRK